MGVVLGTFTGIMPGIHVNTLGEIWKGNPVTLFSMGLTHTFLDVVPTTFLGVPDEGTALSVLPAHRLAQRGRAMEVVRIALWASAMAVLLSFPLSIFYVKLATHYSPWIGRVAVGILVVLLVVFSGKNWPRTLLIIVLSGLLGLVVFSLPLTHQYYLLFTGLFGIPSVVGGIRGEAPYGEDASIRMRTTSFLVYSSLGTLVGMAASLLPAFTPSQGAVLVSFLSREERPFLVALFSINTSNFMFSFFNYLATGRVRNGIVARMPPLSWSAVHFYLVLSLSLSILILLYGEHLSLFLLRLLGRIPYAHLNGVVLLFLLILALFFDGVLGVFVLLSSALLGIFSLLIGAPRRACMGVLMVPLLVG